LQQFVLFLSHGNRRAKEQQEQQEFRSFHVSVFLKFAYKIHFIKKNISHLISYLPSTFRQHHQYNMIELRSPNSAKQKHIVLISVKFIFHVLSYQRVTYLLPF